MKKAIYIILEDNRETGLAHGDGITGKILYSLQDVCEFLIKRVWYFEPERRKWIEEMRAKHGVVKAWHNHIESAWLYSPSYIKRFVEVT